MESGAKMVRARTHFMSYHLLNPICRVSIIGLE